MLPKKELNIYPKNETNINALISYYFDEYEVNRDNAIELIMEKTSISLNQFEFMFRKLNESYLTIFRKELSGKIKLTNLLDYSINALAKNNISGGGSANRIRITKRFRNFVKETEININYLEKNN